MTESVFAQMLPIIDSAIVDLMVTMKSDNPHKSRLLEKLYIARIGMVQVIGDMDEIYPVYPCDGSVPCAGCKYSTSCSEHALKRERIEGKVILSIDMATVSPEWFPEWLAEPRTIVSCGPRSGKTAYDGSIHFVIGMGKK